MDDEKVLVAARQELLNPSLEVTKQYLGVMEVGLECELPRVARVDLCHEKDLVTVYFYIKNERFFIAVSLSKIGSVKGVWVESGHRVYLTATSKKLSFLELSKLFPVKGLTGWSKGELRKSGKSKHQFTRVSYEPNLNEAYSLEEKLIELLTSLKGNVKNILELGSYSNACISVCRNQYISANAGILLDIDTIRLLNAMNLKLEIDTYISGSEIV